MNCVDEKLSDFFIKEIFQKAINHDFWLSQIIQLSLSKSAKDIVMHSWKENINDYEIYLNLRNEFKHLYSKKVDSIIQTECYNKFGISVKLRIEKTRNFSKLTPMELIYCLYKEKIVLLKQELLKNIDIMLIQSVFDAVFNEEDILIC